MINLHDKTFEPFISTAEIESAIVSMAKEINKDFVNDTPIFIGILNGSFMILSDLMKHYKGMCEVSFVKMASYDGTISTNHITELIGINENLEGRTVIVVEDIIETGTTLIALKKLFEKEKVKQVKIATLLLKPERYNEKIKIDYIGISIPNHFVVGYGLDYNGLGRNLSEIYQLKE